LIVVSDTSPVLNLARILRSCREMRLSPFSFSLLTFAAQSGAARVRDCEEIGWQAKAPAPQKRKPLHTNVGQTLSSVNPAISR
jgi:hypothetical protein